MHEAEPEPESTAIAPPTPAAARVDILPPNGGASAIQKADDAAFSSSEDISQLIAGLAAAQLAFDDIERNQTANVQSRREGARSYTYKYADLASVLTGIRPALASNGLALMQFPDARASSLIVTTFLGHASGQWVRNKLGCRLESLDPQSIGSAITYLRRYALQAMLGVAPDDGVDDDGQRATTAPPQRREVAMPQRASANGNGHGHGATVPTSPAGAPILLKRLEKRETEKDTTSAKAGTPYWVMEFTEGTQALTFSTTKAEQLESWFLSETPLTKPTTKKRGTYTYLEHVAPLAGGAQ